MKSKGQLPLRNGVYSKSIIHPYPPPQPRCSSKYPIQNIIKVPCSWYLSRNHILARYGSFFSSLAIIKCKILFWFADATFMQTIARHLPVQSTFLNSITRMVEIVLNLLLSTMENQKLINDVYISLWLYKYLCSTANNSFRLISFSVNVWPVYIYFFYLSRPQWPKFC